MMTDSMPTFVYEQVREDCLVFSGSGVESFRVFGFDKHCCRRWQIRSPAFSRCLFGHLKDRFYARRGNGTDEYVVRPRLFILTVG